MHLLGINYLSACVFMLCRHYKVFLQEFSGVPLFLFSGFLFCFVFLKPSGKMGPVWLSKLTSVKIGSAWCAGCL